MTILPITLSIAGACGLISLWLAFRVIVIRRRERVSIGHGTSDALLARSRAHGNFSEYAPLFLILLALVELAIGGGTALWLAGAAFALSRIAHALGMDRPAPNVFRIVGTVGTLTLLGGLAIYAVALPYLLPAAGPTIIG